MDEHDRDLEERLRRSRPSHAPDPARAAKLEEALLRHRSWRTRRYRPLAGLALAAGLAGAFLLLQDRPLGSGGFELRRTGRGSRGEPVFTATTPMPGAGQEYTRNSAPEEGSSQSASDSTSQRILERAHAALALGNVTLARVVCVQIGNEEHWSGIYSFGPDPLNDIIGGDIPGMPRGGPTIERFLVSRESERFTYGIYFDTLAPVGTRDLVIEHRAIRMNVYRLQIPGYGEVTYSLWEAAGQEQLTKPGRQRR